MTCTIKYDLYMIYSKIIITLLYINMPYLSDLTYVRKIHFFYVFSPQTTHHSYAALMTLEDLRWSAWYVRDLTVTL